MPISFTDSPDGAGSPLGLRERQRRMRDECILETAFALIAEKGYEAMTMEDLADRVGISKPTLYHHFDSKEAIAVRALVKLNEDAVRCIHGIDPGGTPVERLRLVVEWLVRTRFTATSAAFLRARPAMTPARLHPDYLRAAQARVDAVTEIIRSAQAAGQVSLELPAIVLSHMLFSLACNPDYDALLADEVASPQDIVDTILTVFFDGIKPA
jgi:AcrR family transcriptional regulator